MLVHMLEDLLRIDRTKGKKKKGIKGGEMQLTLFPHSRPLLSPPYVVLHHLTKFPKMHLIIHPIKVHKEIRKQVGICYQFLPKQKSIHHLMCD
jgi:hypothetical protein